MVRVIRKNFEKLRSRCKYGYNADGSIKTIFRYNWDTVVWDMTSGEAFTVAKTAQYINKVLPSVCLSASAVNMYISETKKCKQRWPFLWVGGVRVIPRSAVDQIVDIFRRECILEKPKYTTRVYNTDCSKKPIMSYTHFEKWEIVQNGLDTPDAAKLLNSILCTDRYNANQIKDMCRDKRIPSVKIDERHYIHKTNIEEYASTVQTKATENKTVVSMDCNNDRISKTERDIHEIKESIAKLEELVVKAVAFSSASCNWIKRNFPNETLNENQQEAHNDAK